MQFFINMLLDFELGRSTYAWKPLFDSNSLSSIMDDVGLLGLVARASSGSGQTQRAVSVKIDSSVRKLLREQITLRGCGCFRQRAIGCRDCGNRKRHFADRIKNVKAGTIWH